MNRIFDYNGAAVSHSKPVKQLKTVKKFLVIDSADRDTAKYPFNGDFVVYLPRVYENVVSIRLAGAEFPSDPYIRSTGTAVPTSGGTEPLYYILDIEGLNKIDECSVGADRSGYPDGIFAKIPVSEVNGKSLYNDHSDPENIGHYTPAIGKLDRMHIRTRLHSQKQSGDYIFWTGPAVSPNPARESGEFSLTFEIEMLDNVFDDFSSFESRVADRA
jgi:hypothetical protein